MKKHETIHLVYPQKPYRDFRAERRRKAEKHELRENLGWVAVFIIAVAVYVLIGASS